MVVVEIDIDSRGTVSLLGNDGVTAAGNFFFLLPGHVL